ncbi:hypothetical protein [Paractinoplanes aksuensis]|uniref:hypothetical protein n=1 Tax=Paractinoplanes aksuensis TaxID=2939490 RepID=UPI0034DB04D8
MSRPQALELSQPGRSSAVARSCTPGVASVLMTTRLYGPPRTSDGVHEIWPALLDLVQNGAWPGCRRGAVMPGTTVVATGRAPVPMSTVRTVLCCTPARYSRTALVGARPRKAAPFCVWPSSRSWVSPSRVNGASVRSRLSTSSTTRA